MAFHRSAPEGCEEHEHPDVHLGDACGDGNELAYGGYEAPYECADGTVAVEVSLGFLNFLTVDEASVTQARVGEGVDNGASDE